jgi:hypothetical protein
MHIISEQNHTGLSSSERDLWAAVLDRAILDLDDITERPRSLAWFKSPRDDVGAFLWICMILDLEPVKVQLTILQQDKERVAA